MYTHFDFIYPMYVLYNGSSMVDPALTCFEPEAPGILVEGHDFHKFYFDCKWCISCHLVHILIIL